MPCRTLHLIGLALIGWSVCAGSTHAADFHAGPQDYREFLPRLVAGDRLLLRPGEYQRGLPLQGLNGEPGRPVVIEGPASGQRARFIARAGANTISLTDVRHLHIRNLELDGGNRPVDAVKAEGHAAYAHFVTLENLHIHDYAASQQNVGISTKCPVFGWVIRGNRIERVGTGMYLGNSDGSDPFVNGLIEGNRISETLGYNLQIKHQKRRPEDLPEAGQAHTTRIRANLFSKTDGQPGPLARPNVLIGDLPPQGPGSEDRTLVYGNLFWQNPGESLFQGEGHLSIYNNVFITRGPDAIRIQPHNGVPRDVRVLHNTVVAAGNGITLRTPEDNPYTQVVAGNVVFSPHPISGGEQQGNLTGAFDRAGWFLTRPHAELGRIDLSPRRALAAQPISQPAGGENWPEFEVDFFGRPRQGVSVGAFGSRGAAPLQTWLHQAGFSGEGL
ncbi:MAG: hypothetical protein Q8O79_03355 [Pseudomonadota bacterium]|nr:hypothetical protein [Pseudomonadota bacterium]